MRIAIHKYLTLEFSAYFLDFLVVFFLVVFFLGAAFFLVAGFFLVAAFFLGAYKTYRRLGLDLNE